MQSPPSSEGNSEPLPSSLSTGVWYPEPSFTELKLPTRANGAISSKLESQFSHFHKQKQQKTSREHVSNRTKDKKSRVEEQNQGTKKQRLLLATKFIRTIEVSGLICYTAELVLSSTDLLHLLLDLVEHFLFMFLAMFDLLLTEIFNYFGSPETKGSCVMELV